VIRKQGSLAWKKDSWNYHWGVVVVGRLLIFKDERVSRKINGRCGNVFMISV
jgi:hypothetical protein